MIGSALSKQKKKTKSSDQFDIYDKGYCYDDDFTEDRIPVPYVSPADHSFTIGKRDENPIIFFEFHSSGGRSLRDGTITPPQNLGKLYFELRKDLLPVSCMNFVYLVTGKKGYGSDGVCYHFKGIRVHRIIKNVLFQSGDLLDEQGMCSRSSYGNGCYFRDENFILRHTGPGCISYCNRGPDTNGSLFQVCFTTNKDLDDRHVVFGCLATNESYECLERINGYGTTSGEPLEEIRISDCGLEYPDASSLGL